MKLSTLLAAPLLLATLAAPALAETPASTPPPSVYVQPPAPESRNSINVSPLGLLFGDVSMTYEHLFSGGNGVIVDAGFGDNSSSKGSEAHGSFGVGYRWHWHRKQNSGFLGISAHQSVGAGTMTYNPGSASEKSYDMDVRSTTLTANIGKRWMLGQKWNITLRFGLGLGTHSASAKESTPEAKMAEQDMNAILSLLPIGAEGELSVGYNF